MVGGWYFVERLFNDEDGRARTKMGRGRKRVSRMYCNIGGWSCLDGCRQLSDALFGYQRCQRHTRKYDEDGCSRGGLEWKQPDRGRRTVGNNDDRSVTSHRHIDDRTHNHPRLCVYRKREWCVGWWHEQYMVRRHPQPLYTND